MCRRSKVIVSLLGVALLVGTMTAHAAPGTADVARTIHNLSNTASVENWDTYSLGMETYATVEDEVCVFCHTPHGGDSRGPLWNHQLPTSTWTHYNSATLGSTGALPAGDGSRPVSDESLLCLSCHDGSVATNHVLNPSNDLGQVNPIENINQGAGQDVFIEALFGIPAARIGEVYGGPGNQSGKLQDDHPISFSYDDALADPGETELHAIGTPVGRSIRFFGANNRVECSSCHDPHVKYDTNLDAGADPAYTPFLLTTNAGSYLCLSCHNK